MVNSKITFYCFNDIHIFFTHCLNINEENNHKLDSQKRKISQGKDQIKRSENPVQETKRKVKEGGNIHFKTTHSASRQQLEKQLKALTTIVARKVYFHVQYCFCLY